MPISSDFDLPTLQLKHPDAFYQRLLFAHFKIINLTPTAPVLIFSFCLILFISLGSAALGHILSTALSIHAPKMAFNLGVLIILPLIYCYVWYAHYQACFSSKFAVQRLQIQLYLLGGFTLILATNFKYLQTDVLNLISLCGLFFSLFLCVFTELFYKRDSSAIERVKLQKLRQLAFWSYQQSLKQKEHQTYFYALHLQAMQEEQKLSASIKSSFKDFIDKAK
ncbi:hypothetical protein M5F04_10680 [Acinetobacter sp. ANC 7200]|uniref:hypothetical protein n=2 Tax=Moraxellaceae TaxID=468 RepID=UPI000991B60C|nr:MULTISPECIES: hypothetical protein [Acinetobacter]MCL6245005.1 hypothetical protein [Acinetobacter amyesii]OOV84074.1 hypothetical protein B1201_02205 [Acinetobacter sp. ANC 5600]